MMRAAMEQKKLDPWVAVLWVFCFGCGFCLWFVLVCLCVPRYLGLLQLLHILLTSKRSSDRQGHVLDRLQRKKPGLDSLPHIALSFNSFRFGRRSPLHV